MAYCGNCSLTSLDIASQLVLKWARYGSSYVISPTDDFTRLTLDTLALCAMDFRFNSFYKEDLHPFVSSMVGFLSNGGKRAQRPGYMAPFHRSEDQQFFKDIEYMRELSGDLVQQRVDNPTDKKDLLNAMVKGKDPKTGENLSHDTMIDNMITFLIAGQPPILLCLYEPRSLNSLQGTRQLLDYSASSSTTFLRIPKHTGKHRRKSTESSAMTASE